MRAVSYLQRAFGPIWGFLYGWGAAVVINPASIAFVAMGFASYLGFFIPTSAGQVKAMAAGSILLLTALNCHGLKVGALTQNVLTLIQIGAVLALVLLGLLVPGGNAANLQPFWPTESMGRMIGPFGVAMILVLGAYDCWIEITYVGSELKRPERDMSLSVVLGPAGGALITVAILVSTVGCNTGSSSRRHAYPTPWH